MYIGKQALNACIYKVDSVYVFTQHESTEVPNLI